MGRSVSHIGGADAVTYFNIEFSDDDDIARTQWLDLKEYVVETLTKMFPSLTDCDRWDDNETHIILENSFCEIAISEYCGLVSVSWRVLEDDYSDKLIGLATQWVKKNSNKFVSIGDLKRVGGFSDGTSVYEKVVA